MDNSKEGRSVSGKIAYLLKYTKYNIAQVIISKSEAIKVTSKIVLSHK